MKKITNHTIAIITVIAVIFSCAYCARAGTLEFDGVPVDITTASGEDLVIAPAEGGKTQIGDAAGTNSYAVSNDDLYTTGVIEANGVIYSDSGITSGGNIIPDTDSVNSLGSSSAAWANVYADTISGYNADLALNPASGYGLTGSVTRNAATGNETAYDLAATINKATSGNYTGLKLNVTETSAPGSSDKLLDLQVGGASKFNIDNSGKLGIKETGSAPVRYTYLQAADQSADITYTLPAALPSTDNYVLSSLTTGTLSWAASSAGAAAVDSALVTVGNDATLTGERALTGTDNQITVTDGGANSTITLSTPQDIHTAATPAFAGITLSGLTASKPVFSGADKALTSSGTMPVSQGGTGLTTIAAGSVLAANSSDTLSAITSASGLTALINNAGTSSWNSSTGTGNSVFASSPTIATPTITTSAVCPLLVGGTGTTSDLSLKTTSGTGTTGADMHFLVGTNGGTEAMTILNSGRVGIGDGSPGYPLHVKNGGILLNLESSNATLGAEFRLDSTIGTNGRVFTIYSGLADNTAGAGVLSIYDESGTTDRLVIDDTGDVGIGVTDPDTQLEVFNAGTQLKLSFDATDNTTFGTDTNGDLTITPSGSEAIVTKQLSITGASRVRVDKDDAQTFTDGDTLVIEYDDEVEDNLGEWASNTFTATEAGWYLAGAEFSTETAAWTSSHTIRLWLYKEGAVHSLLGFNRFFTLTTKASIGGSALVYLAAGETLDFRARHNRGANTDSSGLASENYCWIHRLS